MYLAERLATQQLLLVEGEELSSAFARYAPKINNVMNIFSLIRPGGVRSHYTLQKNHHSLHWMNL